MNVEPLVKNKVFLFGDRLVEVYLLPKQNLALIFAQHHRQNDGLLRLPVKVHFDVARNGYVVDRWVNLPIRSIWYWEDEDNDVFRFIEK